MIFRKGFFVLPKLISFIGQTIIMIEIKKYTASQIIEFVESNYFNSLPVVPVSKARAYSYLNNPAVSDNDFLMYLAVENENIVGFRTLFADYINTCNGIKKVAWLSGNWVKPDMRRKGVSSVLFKHVFDDWHNNVVYTNYAPASKAVYDKTDNFYRFCSITGYRFYLQSAFYQLLINRNEFFKRIKLLLKLIDNCVNLFLQFKVVKKPVTGKYYITECVPDTNIYNFLAQNTDKGISYRQSKNYLHIFEYPWLNLQTGNQVNNYPFSGQFKNYKNIMVKAEINRQICGFFQVHIKNGVATVPFFVAKNQSYLILVKFLYYYLNKNKALYVTIYNNNLLNYFNKHALYIGKKSMERNFFASKNLYNELGIIELANLQDGEGDVAFV